MASVEGDFRPNEAKPQNEVHIDDLDVDEDETMGAIREFRKQEEVDRRAEDDAERAEKDERKKEKDKLYDKVRDLEIKARDDNTEAIQREYEVAMDEWREFTGKAWQTADEEYIEMYGHNMPNPHDPDEMAGR